jgi:hypothetical protein
MHLVVVTEKAHGDFSPKFTRVPARGEQCAAVTITRGWINVAVQLPRNTAEGQSQTPATVPPTISLTPPAVGSLSLCSSTSSANAGRAHTSAAASAPIAIHTRGYRRWQDMNLVLPPNARRRCAGKAFQPAHLPHCRLCGNHAMRCSLLIQSPNGGSRYDQSLKNRKIVGGTPVRPKAVSSARIGNCRDYAAPIDEFARL